MVLCRIFPFSKDSKESVDTHADREKRFEFVPIDGILIAAICEKHRIRYDMIRKMTPGLYPV